MVKQADTPAVDQGSLAFQGLSVIELKFFSARGKDVNKSQEIWKEKEQKEIGTAQPNKKSPNFVFCKLYIVHFNRNLHQNLAPV